jgi:hypothetical protein
MDKIDKNLIINILLILVIIIISFRYCKKTNILKSDKELLLKTGDTIVKTINKDGSESAKISLLTSYNTKLLLQIQTKDESIKSLQEAVKQYKNKLTNNSSVTVFTTNTIYTGNGTTTVSIVDSSTVYIASNKDTTWVKWNTIANKDSTHLDLKIKEAYTVVIGDDSKWYQFRKLPFVEVTNKNPFSSTKAIRAFKIEEKVKTRFGIGIQAGYGITLGGLSPYVGMGLNFKLL